MAQQNNNQQQQGNPNINNGAPNVLTPEQQADVDRLRPLADRLDDALLQDLVHLRSVYQQEYTAHENDVADDRVLMIRAARPNVSYAEEARLTTAYLLTAHARREIERRTRQALDAELVAYTDELMFFEDPLDPDYGDKWDAAHDAV